MATLANIPCPSGHEMITTTVQGLRASPQGAAYGPGFQCDRCHATYAAAADAVAHCAACEYDLCGACAAELCAALECDSGHQLLPRYAADLAAENAAYAAGYCCNCCGAENAGFPVRHCSACAFDMCPRCVAARIGHPQPPPSHHHHQPPHPPVLRPPIPGGPPMPVPLAGAPPMMPRPPRPLVHGGAAVPLWESAEWRGVLGAAGICRTSLAEAGVREGVLRCVAGMMQPAAGRLTSLPPLEFIPLERRDIAARLRAWFQTYNRPHHVDMPHVVMR